MMIGSQKRQKRNYEKRERVFISAIFYINVLIFLNSDHGPKKWMKGPDVGSKSRTTQYQYKKLLKDHKKLEDFGWKKAVNSESKLNSSDDDSDNIEIPGSVSRSVMLHLDAVLN